VLIIATFQTSARMTRAYGLAVLFDMLITTHFFTMVLLCVWQVPVILPIAFYLVFATLEATFLSATAEKIPTGGWFSLMMSAIYTAIMLLWFWGSRHKNRYFSSHATNLSKLLQVKGGGKDEPSITVMGQTPCSRLPGAALWYTDVLKGAPPTLERQLTRFPALHAINVVFTVRFVPVPSVYDDERFLVKSLPIPGFYHVIARYGYGERISQDETFADMILQRISMLQYNTLHAMVTTSPQLQGMLPNLSSNFDDSAKPDHSTPPILEHESLYVASQPLVPRLSAPTSVFEPEDFTAIQITGDAGTAMERRSAPVGSVAEAYPAGKPRSSAHLHGFTDASFQPAFRPEAEGTLDATSAATLAQWAAKVANGAIVLPTGNEAVEDLARDIAAVTEAKEHGVTFVVGSTQARASEKANIFKKYLVHEPFLFLVHNFTSNADLAFGIPLDKLAIVGLPYHLD
jgi:KUP system potassium uptake protein